MHYKHLSSDGWEPEGAGVCVLSVSLFCLYGTAQLQLYYSTRDVAWLHA